ncbi:MAG: phosphatase PAP2 family protein [Lachnospiraceae bacterium]|nr:phosphatase PAP2 family protein [Lachnospiraceae bacterium]
MEKKKSLATAIVMTVITMIYTALVYFVDRKPIGPNDTQVGFAWLNGSFRDAVGLNLTLDKITDIFMLLAIAVAASFAIVGLVMLIKRKSLLKVDKMIWGLAVVYIVVAVLYVVFDKVALNYRPFLMPDETELESSFPSSHVFVICTIMSTAIVAWDSLLSKKAGLANALRAVAIIIMIASFCGRLISGVHWFTDIIGGALYAASLTAIYSAVMDRIKE